MLYLFGPHLVISFSELIKNEMKSQLHNFISISFFMRARRARLTESIIISRNRELEV